MPNCKHYFTFLKPYFTFIHFARAGTFFCLFFIYFSGTYKSPQPKLGTEYTFVLF